MPTDQDRWRAATVAISLGALFCLLILRYFTIQITETDHWAGIARRQHFFTVQEPFVRGTIYSNPQALRPHPDQPQKLVMDIQKFHLFADPLSIPCHLRSQVADRLTHHLHLSQEKRAELIARLEKKSRSRKLAMWLDDDAKQDILQWWKPFAKTHRLPGNSLYFVSDYQRSYPFGKLLGQVLHTVQHQRDEATGQAIPTGGLEYALNDYLKGKRGLRRLMRSPRNSFEIGEVMEKPEDGADVYLTIHHVLQAIVEEELARAVNKVHAKGGWAVMMDPCTGAIFALAQYPFFYPARYTDYYNDPELGEATKVKALTDTIEPGSIMKPLTALVALLANEELERRGETPLFDPEAKMQTKDGRFPGRSRPIREPTRSFSYLNLDMALKRSSNIYFARLMQRVMERLGAKWYRNVLTERLGLGKPTHIELPGESGGVVPRIGHCHANGALEWSTPTPFSLAFGHNLQVTTLQIARAFAAIANGGVLVQPTLVHKIVKKTEEGKEKILQENCSKTRIEAFPQVANSSIMARIVRAMKYVTQGKRSDIPGYTQAGKTGTAEKIVDGSYSKDKNVAAFAGFAPAKDPLFVLVVCIDEPEKRIIPGVGGTQWGGYAAAPAFREIGKRTLAYLGCAPDNPHGYPLHDPRYDPEKADWASETKALEELLTEWNGN